QALHCAICAGLRRVRSYRLPLATGPIRGEDCAAPSSAEFIHRFGITGATRTTNGSVGLARRTGWRRCSQEPLGYVRVFADQPDSRRRGNPAFWTDGGVPREAPFERPKG